MSIDDANRTRSLDLDPERGGDRSGADVDMAERSLDRQAGGREQDEQDQEDRQAGESVAPRAKRDFGERRLGVPDRRQDQQFADPSLSERGRARQVDGPTR